MCAISRLSVSNDIYHFISDSAENTPVQPVSTNGTEEMVIAGQENCAAVPSTPNLPMGSSPEEPNTVSILESSVEHQREESDAQQENRYHHIIIQTLKS